MNQSGTCFSISAIRDSSHPFYSATQQPWAAVTIGHVFARLTVTDCSACRVANLTRSYFFDKLALIKPMADFDEKERTEFLSCNSLQLFNYIQAAPAWITHSADSPFRKLHSIWPKATRVYMTQSRRFFSQPFAKHVPIGSEEKYLGNACVTCGELLAPFPSSRAHINLLINDHDQALAPLPVICTL